MRKITQITIMAVFAITALTFSACTTTDENTEAEPSTPAAPTKTNKELLTANNWVRTARTLNAVDDWSTEPACRKDDIDKFFENGDFIFDRTNTNCNPNDPQVLPFTWEFTDTEQTIVKRSDGYTFTIKELTETKLVYEETRTNGDVSRSTFKAVPTFTAMITNANGWKLTAHTNNGQDIYNNNLECDNANIYKYKADGTAIEDEGALKCNPNDPQTRATGTWNFAENETKLTLSILGGTAEIKELSPTTLVLTVGSQTVTYTAQ